MLLFFFHYTNICLFFPTVIHIAFLGKKKKKEKGKNWWKNVTLKSHKNKMAHQSLSTYSGNSFVERTEKKWKTKIQRNHVFLFTFPSFYWDFFFFFAAAVVSSYNIFSQSEWNKERLKKTNNEGEFTNMQ